MDLMTAGKPIPLPSLLSFPPKTTIPKPIPSPAPSHAVTPPPVATTTTTTSSLEQTKQLHAQIIRTHFHPRLQAYSSPAAQLNSIVTSYIKNHAPHHALKAYAHARKTGLTIDSFTAPSVLKACAQLSSIHAGREIHAYVLKAGLDWDIFVHNALMQMYSECDAMESSKRVFDEMPERDVVAWSTMIRGYGKIGSFGKAVELMREMLLVEVKPSEVAMINMLNIFAEVGNLRIGSPVHACLIKNSGIGSPGVNANTALIHMYAKCGSMSMARRVFDKMIEKSTASWTAMVAGYIRSKDLVKGLELFEKMQLENVQPNEVTMLSMVIECGLIGVLELGKWLHAYILRNGFEMSIALATALVDMYAKRGDLTSARELFDAMEERDVMTWTVMIAGYAQANCIDQAFGLFSQMKEAKVRANEVTMVNLLSLCAEAGALDRGKWVHASINKRRVEADVVLSTALVDMYAKCGDVEGAQKVFDEAKDRDVCMWNAMLNGLAMNGYGEEAIRLFNHMENECIKPSGITFIGVLRACSHSGWVEEGKRFFERMEQDFGLVPKVEHYGCMVDLLGRAGLLDEAHEMIGQMPVAPNLIVWGALLAACKLHKEPSLGEVAAKELLKLAPHNTGYSVLLSNLYATQNRWNDVAEVRKAIKDTGIKKEPGISSIELNGSVHEFVMGDHSHPQTKQIQEMVDEMQRELKLAGHVVDTSAALLNVDEEEKEAALTYHSEKLAMAFGLISTAAGTPIRIVKNLRVCDDCHAATKLLSKIYGRVIIVRDRNRFHRFSEGTCSCRDYW